MTDTCPSPSLSNSPISVTYAAPSGPRQTDSGFLRPEIKGFGTSAANNFAANNGARARQAPRMIPERRRFMLLPRGKSNNNETPQRNERLSDNRRKNHHSHHPA